MDFPVIPIDNPEVGSFKVAVLNTNEPLWHGNFQTGKLTVYYAEIVEGVPLQPTVSLVYVVSAQREKQFDSWGYEIYSAVSSLGAMIDDLMAKINTFYIQIAMEEKDAARNQLH